MMKRWLATTPIVVFGLAATPGLARAENLQDAWAIALQVNQQLQSQQALSVSAGYSLAAARSARWPTVRNFTFNAFLSATPAFNTPFSGTSTTGSSAAGGSVLNAAAATGLPSTFSILGPGQRDLPASITYASIPLYTGGRLLRNIDAANAQVGSQRTEEFRSALDLKLTVAEAYVGVLRARRNLQVQRSDVDRLTAFARDVRNRREQGLAIRSDELAAEVSLANARLGEIQARTSLEAAWATYNRYLCRRMTEVVSLEELSVLPEGADWKAMAREAMDAHSQVAQTNDLEIEELTRQAMSTRPELAGLVQQARALEAQAEATRAGIRPQVGFLVAFAYLGNNNQTPQGIGAALFYADWTITDSGATRRRAAAQHLQEVATMKRRADMIAAIALDVRTRWLDLHQSRLRVPIARLAVDQSEENLTVVTNRYREQLSTYTEVLDAENRRVQSQNNFYNAIYDESLALFRLHRSVGDL